LLLKYCSKKEESSIEVTNGEVLQELVLVKACKTCV